MARIKNAIDRMAREKQVQEMIEEGLSQNEMARRLELSPQAVQKFLKVRGWKTKGTKEAARPAE